MYGRSTMSRANCCISRPTASANCCRSLTVVPLTDGYPKMYSLCHRHLSFWFYQESDVKGERFSSEGDAAFIIPRMRLRPLPTPHLPRPYAIQAAPLAPDMWQNFSFSRYLLNISRGVYGRSRIDQAGSSIT